MCNVLTEGLVSLFDTYWELLSLCSENLQACNGYELKNPKL